MASATRPTTCCYESLRLLAVEVSLGWRRPSTPACRCAIARLQRAIRASNRGTAVAGRSRRALEADCKQCPSHPWRTSCEETNPMGDRSFCPSTQVQVDRSMISRVRRSRLLGKVRIFHAICESWIARCIPPRRTLSAAYPQKSPRSTVCGESHEYKWGTAPGMTPQAVPLPSMEYRGPAPQPMRATVAVRPSPTDRDPFLCFFYPTTIAVRVY